MARDNKLGRPWVPYVIYQDSVSKADNLQVYNILIVTKKFYYLNHTL